MSNQIVVAAFYKFVKLDDYKELQKPLYNLCEAHQIKGSILLAEEGINGTIAGTRPAMNAVINYLKEDPRLKDLQQKVSYTDAPPFRKMKVRLKREIVTLGVDVDPNEEVGTYVEPSNWNDLINDPDVILIDTRNDYEYEVGTFKGAIDPATDSFGDFPEYVQKHLSDHKDKKIAMFCTGGIRCEKATSYLKGQGFEQVFHLKGGILRYLEEIPQEKSLWQGDCFVFDERITVDHDLKPGNVQFCKHCNRVVPGNVETCPICEQKISMDTTA